MKLTARPAPSITPIQTVSAGSAPAPHGAARVRSTRAASASMRAGDSKSCASCVMYAGSVMYRSRTPNACFTASTHKCT